ncbi:IS110 family transposase [Gordonia sp. WA4-43]|uniref:IS110 family transposase n=1 Tax=Gordonia sp. WA4-43 TaxID=2878678 RepID=UPI001CFBDE9A|nr:IS110 family transposase [Gordonia sp. WA4-43]UCZ92162.1 IS110 family transposase [Gordonia sp. WA4-43]
MEVLHPRCAGMDVSKKDVKVCVRLASPGRKTVQETTTWSSMSGDILRLRDYLIAEQVTCVVMEATGDYWKPFYYLLEDAPFEVMLVNAHDAKNLPGRKTDVSDAAWLAQLAAHGLLRASFVPPEPIRRLRDLTRTRTAITRERGREIQRLEKVLEDAGIKLSVVVSDINGVSSRFMLQALVKGERDPAVLAELSVKQLRRKIPALTQALQGRFTDHHAFLVELHLDFITEHTTRIDALTERIEKVMAPFQAKRDLICTIPGISTTTADVIIAETGGQMAQFPTPGHLASWAGVCPGQHQSAGRVKNVKTRPGNRHLKGALGATALSIASHKGTFLNAKYRRLVRSRGKPKAIVALEHTLLAVVWIMLTDNVVYDEPGPDYHQQRHPERTKNRAIYDLHKLGYDVTITPHGAA